MLCLQIVNNKFLWGTVQSLLPLIHYTEITVILPGTVGDGPGATNIVLTQFQTTTLTLTHNQEEMIGLYALDSLPKNDNYVIIYSPSCHSSKICGWVNSGLWQYTEILKEAPKFVNRKVLAL